MVGVVSKGMVEPALDKFRLSLLLGLAVGGVVTSMRAASEMTSSPQTEPTRREAAH
jgi:hypothetical protein